MHGFSFPFHVDEVVFLANIFKVCFSHNLPFDQKDACVSHIMMANLQACEPHKDLRLLDTNKSLLVLA